MLSFKMYSSYLYVYIYIPNKSPVTLPNFRPNEKCLSDYIGLH